MSDRAVLFQFFPARKDLVTVAHAAEEFLNKFFDDVSCGETSLIAVQSGFHVLTDCRTLIGLKRTILCTTLVRSRTAEALLMLVKTFTVREATVANGALKHWNIIPIIVVRLLDMFQQRFCVLELTLTSAASAINLVQGVHHAVEFCLFLLGRLQPRMEASKLKVNLQRRHLLRKNIANLTAIELLLFTLVPMAIQIPLALESLLAIITLDATPRDFLFRVHQSTM